MQNHKKHYQQEAPDQENGNISTKRAGRKRYLFFSRKGHGGKGPQGRRGEGKWKYRAKKKGETILPSRLLRGKRLPAYARHRPSMTSNEDSPKRKHGKRAREKGGESDCPKRSRPTRSSWSYGREKKLVFMGGSADTGQEKHATRTLKLGKGSKNIAAARQARREKKKYFRRQTRITTY